MAKTRVGINGFGRIGRNFFRAALQRDADFEIVAFNDLGDVNTMAHLLRHDSVLGTFPHDVEAEGGSLKVAGSEIRGLAERDPAALPWRDLQHKDLRRARAAAINLIPTSTGAARAIGLVLPDLKGKVDGISVRAPVPTGSVTDLVVTLGRDATAEGINTAFEQAASSGPLA